MLDAPTADELGLTTHPDAPNTTPHWWQRMHATRTQRGLILAALGGLLVAGVLQVLPGETDYVSPLGFGSNKAVTSRVSDTFNHAKAGDCLTWPDRAPDAVKIVDCKDDHRFEVAESLDLSTFPGSEYGPDAAPPSAARIKQISQEQCQNAAHQYLGPRFDPNGKFTVSLVWSGDKAWKQTGQRRMLCGLQLPGPNQQQLSYKGRVADIDQSKVWPTGTCIGIDPATNQPTDAPVDCSTPHAMEVTGAVNLADKFHDALPPDAQQDAFIKDACTKLTDAYLAPNQLRNTTLTLIYSTPAPPSWAAGSHQVSCNIGSSLGNGGWSTLVNSAKGPLVINGQSPIAPPAIADERLNLPALPPVSSPIDASASQGSSSQGSASQGSSSQGSSSSSSSSGTQHGQQTAQAPQGDQHMPGQQAGPGNGAVPPATGNTYLNGPPPATPDGPPMESDNPAGPAPAGPAPGAPAPAAPGPAGPPGDAGAPPPGQ
ncbi:putative heme/steroid binding protein [Mycobacterium sp. MAA66]